MMSQIMSAAVTIIGVTLLVFALLHLVPGDPIDAMLGEQASGADRAALRAALGLDAPLTTQLVRYYHNLVRLELGDSLHNQLPVAALLAARAPYTLGLALVASAIALLIALPLGIASALRVDGLADRASTLLAVVGAAIPSFVLGPGLLVIFAVWLPWLPVGGADSLLSVILPAATLGLGIAALLTRQLRAAVLAVLNEPFLVAAAARGLSTRRVLRRHTLPNALVPCLTVFGMQLGALLGGAVITETVFAWPGLGTLTIDAIQRRDYPVVQGCVLAIACTYVLVNLATELVCAWLDPRLGQKP